MIRLLNDKLLSFTVCVIFGNIIFFFFFLSKSVHVTDTWPSREWSEVGIKGKNGEWKTTERIGIGGLSLQSLSSSLSFSLHGCGSYSEGTNIWSRMWLGVAALLLQINYWQSEPASWAITTLSVFSFNLKTKSSMVTKEFNVPFLKIFYLCSSFYLNTLPSGLWNWKRRSSIKQFSWVKLYFIWLVHVTHQPNSRAQRPALVLRPVSWSKGSKMHVHHGKNLQTQHRRVPVDPGGVHSVHTVAPGPACWHRLLNVVAVSTLVTGALKRDYFCRRMKVIWATWALMQRKPFISTEDFISCMSR